MAYAEESAPGGAQGHHGHSTSRETLTVSTTDIADSDGLSSQAAEADMHP